MRWSLLALLGCAVEVEPEAVAPPPTQTLDLAISPVVPGSDVVFTIDGLQPNESVYLLMGIDTTFGAGGCPGFVGGLCVDLVPPVRSLVVLTADGAGVATHTVRAPVGLPVGEIAGFQAVARRGPGGADSTKSPPVLVRSEPPMELSSPDVLPNSDPACDIVLPSQYWCGNDNPEIRWTGVPANTVSLAFLYKDVLIDFPHWAVYDIPPTAAAIAPGSSGGGFFFPPGATEISAIGGPWFGSCSQGQNTYEWRLVALDDRRPSLSGNFNNRFRQLESWVAQHAIAEVALCQE